MKKYLINKLLQNDGWKNDVLIEVDEKGIISSITENAQDKDAQRINGYCLPGFQNAHSHAFQYAMSGLAENHSTSGVRDDFWSWREAMYQLALSVSPDEMEGIATMLYSEMVRHGYTNVAEFHYVHHDKNGHAYSNLAEMGERLISAAKTAGINITLVPIFYQKGGFGKQPTEGQRRFISRTIDEYMRLLEASDKACSVHDHATVGIGIHSMRGVDPTEIKLLAKSGPQDLPFHIHVSEQLKEIEDCIHYTGKRPVEWLLDNVNMNDRYHLVHATHLTDEETIGIASKKANVVLCPTTEGNLGDGLFPLINYAAHDGAWSIGTDSHVGINPFEEIRLLDYGQRLTTHKRDILAGKNGKSGENAIAQATITGRKAMGNSTETYFAVGNAFNACIIDSEAPLLANTTDTNLVSSIIYTADVRHISQTIVNGEVVWNGSEQRNRASIVNRFNQIIKSLANR
ncbi:MAG: formimidoylglutamate deiminase [Crocinitomicaceae bacterium]